MIAAITGAVLVVPVRLSYPDCRTGLASSFVLWPDSVRLRVNVATQKKPLLAELAEDFEKKKLTDDGRCIDVKVEEGDSGETAAALVRGERGEGEPDVWLPSARAWVDFVEHHRKGAIPTREHPSINKSPEVIAVPEPVARALGWSEENGWSRQIEWTDLYLYGRDPARWKQTVGGRWERFWLARPNPTKSTSGLFATLAEYTAAQGCAGLPGSLSVNSIREAPAGVTTFVKGMEQAALLYDATSVELFDRLGDVLASGSGIVSALPVQEVSLVNYNRGSASGQVLGEKVHQPKTRLVALYPPDGTRLADQPYVILDQSEAAEKFRHFLQSPGVQEIFHEKGFRRDGRLHDSVIRDQGRRLADVETTELEHPRQVIAAVLAEWPKHRKRARILIVTDLSTSDRIRAVSNAVRGMSGKVFDDGDEIGVWSLTSAPSLRDEIAPLGPASDFPTGPWNPSRGATRLHASIEQAMSVFGDGNQETPASPPPDCVADTATLGDDPARRINSIVVVSDRPHDSKDPLPDGSTLDAVLAQLRTATRDRGVRIFPIAFAAAGNCGNESLRAIAQASFLDDAECVTNDEDIAAKLRQVIERIVPVPEPLSR